MSSFNPALVVVDFQEDFCPPSGSLAVQGGRDIAPIINNLMTLPFALRIATQDWHPADHISFASNQPAPHNTPFTSTVVVPNPHNPSETETIRLWPDHCIQDTPGAALIPEFDAARVDHIVKKGQERRVEMYSAFKDTFTAPCVSESSLAQVLRDANVTHVYVVGLAFDYCVKWTAIHAAKEGYETYVIEEATRGVDRSDGARENTWRELKDHGVAVISVEGAEVAKVRNVSS